jgi:HD-like signal output (HDOD) protein
VSPRCRRCRPSTTEVATIVASDVATSAELLKLVNSAFFGLPREVYSVEAAVRLLGLDNVQALVLASSLFRVNEALAWVLDVEELRAHSLRRAAIARSIAQLEGWAGPERDIAVLSCMLRDVGRLVLAEGRPDAAAELKAAVEAEPEPPSPTRQAELELAAYGCTVAQASAYLLGLWGFAPAVVHTVAAHPMLESVHGISKFERLLDFAGARSTSPAEHISLILDDQMTEERALAWNVAADHVIGVDAPS